MQQKNCKICGSCSTQVNWVKAKGLQRGNKCLACAAACVRAYRATPEGLTARRASAAKHSERVRATPEGRAAHNTASSKSIAARYQTDKFFKFKTDLRSRITHAFSDEGYACNSLTSKVLGASFETVLARLTAPLGYTEIPEGYAIDHVIPLAVAFDEESIAALNHYTNLQLLPTSVNREKSDTLPDGRRARDLTLEERKVIVTNVINNQTNKEMTHVN